jgi:energy-coupling factor transporter ATP-binding protein EcfA2
VIVISTSPICRQSAAYLSGGEKRKVALAGALVLEPELLIMDEPFEGLAPKSRDDLIGLLNRLHETKHVSFILTTHEVDIVPQLADSVYMLVQGGGIAERGTPAVSLAGRTLAAAILTAGPGAIVRDAARLWPDVADPLDGDEAADDSSRGPARRVPTDP